MMRQISAKRSTILAAFAFGIVNFGALPAKAVPIDYTFTGTADVVLNGVSISGAAYTVSLFSDTGTVTSGGGEFFNTATSATFAVNASSGTLGGSLNEVISNPSFAGGFVGFGQSNLDGFFVEGATGLGSYDLTTSYPQTFGGISQTAGSTYFTSLGNLVFSDISTMSFQATVTPLPATLPLLAGGLGALGLFRWRKKQSR
jgi:hypothetical protein